MSLAPRERRRATHPKRNFRKFSMIGSKAVMGNLVGDSGSPKYISGKEDREHPMAVAMLFCVVDSVAIVRRAVLWKLISSPVARAKSWSVSFSRKVAASLAAAIMRVSSAYWSVTGGSFVLSGWQRTLGWKALAISL